MFEMLDRQFGLAEPNLDPTADGPCQREVRVEYERPSRQTSTVIEVPGAIGKRDPSCSERDRVLSSEVCGLSSQSCSFGLLRRSIRHPTTRLSPYIAISGHTIG